jgi:hypothetical protein
MRASIVVLISVAAFGCRSKPAEEAVVLDVKESLDLLEIVPDANKDTSFPDSRGIGADAKDAEADNAQPEEVVADVGPDTSGPDGEPCAQLGERHCILLPHGGAEYRECRVTETGMRWVKDECQKDWVASHPLYAFYVPTCQEVDGVAACCARSPEHFAGENGGEFCSTVGARTCSHPREFVLECERTAATRILNGGLMLAQCVQWVEIGECLPAMDGNPGSFCEEQAPGVFKCRGSATTHDPAWY